MFETTLDGRKITRLLNDVDKNPKDNIVQFMKKHSIKRLKIGTTEFEIELKWHTPKINHPKGWGFSTSREGED